MYAVLSFGASFTGDAGRHPALALHRMRQEADIHADLASNELSSA
jgi:hypothetical protein